MNFTFHAKDMGINISGVNLDHLPTNICRTIRAGGLKINFIGCSIERSVKETLFNKLTQEYGAVKAQDHEGMHANIMIITVGSQKRAYVSMPSHCLDNFVIAIRISLNSSCGYY